MDQERFLKLVAELRANCAKFHVGMTAALSNFLGTHGMLEAVATHNIDQITLMGMAAVLQIRMWKCLGILAAVPFRAVRHEVVSRYETYLPASCNIGHLKAVALFLDVQSYYLINFTWLSTVPGVVDPDAPCDEEVARSTLWRCAVLANLDPAGFTSHPVPAAAAVDRRNPSSVRDGGGARTEKAAEFSGTWTEKKAAEFSSYSTSTLKRMRASGEIPSTLYRQRGKGGKVLYHQQAFTAWFEQRPKTREARSCRRGEKPETARAACFASTKRSPAVAEGHTATGSSRCAGRTGNSRS